MENASRTKIVIVLIALSLLAGIAPGAAQAREAYARVAHRAALTALCDVRTMPPSFVAQGEFGTAGSVADVVQVSCESVYAGQMVKLSSAELYKRCRGHLIWSSPYPYAPVTGPTFSVQLDGAGNATAVLWAGPSCAPGESLVSADLEEAPYTKVTTSFTVLEPTETKPGVQALPASLTEDNVTGSVATIVEVEFPSVYSERYVDINAEQLYSRCLIKPHLMWVGPDGEVLAASAEGVGKVQLDSSGNAFVVLLGGASCASGPSEIEASLEQAPYTTYTTTFTIEPPQEKLEQPGFTIAKLQRIQGTPASFTASPLTGKLGQTVAYEMVVKNTGNTSLTFSNFVDLHCDSGTIAGGPGSHPVGPGESATYGCSHMLTTLAPYTNEAAVTGTSPGGIAVIHNSNMVEVTVPHEPAFTIKKLQEVAGGATGFTSGPLIGTVGQTVDYQITVRNTGNEPLTFSSFTDTHCDSGTIAGGPGEAPVASGGSSTYTCSHMLAAPGRYLNEASVTGTPAGEASFRETSNQVEVTVPTGEALFTAEKLQRIGGPGTFTKSPITGVIGQKVEYEIVVKNTGNTSLTFSNFVDLPCDSGTIAGGPGEVAVAPDSSTTYTCSHVLTSAGPYVNEAVVTGTPPGESPLKQTSNQVEANVPGPVEPPRKAELAPMPTSTPTPTLTLTPTPQSGVEAFCAVSRPVMRGASGPKRGTFKVQVSALGVSSIAFYLDGRKLKTLTQSQSRRGTFTIAINPRRLSYGAHMLTFRTIMSKPACRPFARSSAFVRPLTQRVAPRFTG